MGQRLPIYLPRIAIVVIVALAASAGLTFAAGQRMSSAPKTGASTPAATKRLATIVVPDLRNQAFVFAKGQLADLGFAWRVAGGVQGYPANTVVRQSPAPGTKLINTGAPLVTLTLAQNRGYSDSGTPEDTSPYSPTPLRLANAAVAPVRKKAQPSKHVAAAQPQQKQQTQQKQADTIPSPRPPDFVVPGGRKEPQNELPLPIRAAKLGDWLAAHPKKTNANVKHWLYQNEWVVAGARLGWWHGAEALRTLIAVDSRTQSLWGIGGKSEVLARQALAEVEARAK